MGLLLIDLKSAKPEIGPNTRVSWYTLKHTFNREYEG
jgi:hypothetical protein